MNSSYQYLAKKSSTIKLFPSVSLILIFTVKYPIMFNSTNTNEYLSCGDKCPDRHSYMVLCECKEGYVRHPGREEAIRETFSRRLTGRSWLVS